MDSVFTSRAASPVFSSPSYSPSYTPEVDYSDSEVYTPLPEAVTTASKKYTLVLGGLGFIGSHTSLELLKSGRNIIIVDDLSNSFHNVLSNLRTAAEIWCKNNRRVMPEIQFHKIDYRSKAMHFLLESYSDLVEVPQTNGPARLTRQSRIGGVIHFAAFKSVSDSIARPMQYYKNNVCGLVDLLELLEKHNIRNFVFSSSATVYGTKADAGIPLREEDLVHHNETYTDENGVERTARPEISGLQSPYARTKYFGEAILADLAASDPSWRIIALRYFNPIGCDITGLLGEDPKGVPTNLFPVITQVLTGDRPQLDIFGTDWETRDGTAVRDFIHVSDLARGHIAALSAGIQQPFRTFNLGTGSGTTVSEARALTELGWAATESITNCARDLWNFVSKNQAAQQQQQQSAAATTAAVSATA
ncbi:UDP-glucose 4-epimerase [Plectosphaerella cucumerina]|uniref:UDP-glucose 4-epimerase n=1 Tax=Plectosphaerella cucumerina TaxID=40658 RepID=A0A8K0X306_9PEZI|nr:UDP-glucose 4-epimerase [Plectosphaerella cucumerina]